MSLMVLVDYSKLSLENTWESLRRIYKKGGDNMFQQIHIDDDYHYVYDYEIKSSNCERDGRTTDK